MLAERLVLAENRLPTVTPMLAALGVAALGFAAQKIIRDCLQGFFIVMEDWYRIGEVAEVAGIAGLVEDLNLRRTVLRDLSGPNM